MPVLPILNLYRHDHGHHTTITLAGEIDLAAAPLLRVMVEDCLREGIRTIDIDLTALTFCDVSGLNAFLAAAKRTASVGGSLRLRHPRPIVTRILDITGTGSLLRSPHPAPRTHVPTSFGHHGRGESRTGLMTRPGAAKQEPPGFGSRAG